MSPSNLVQSYFDLTDRMILCASSHGLVYFSLLIIRSIAFTVPIILYLNGNRSELAVGSANHSVYAINVDDGKKKPTEMYGKSFGHSDWVSGSDIGHILRNSSTEGKFHLFLIPYLQMCVTLPMDA